MEEEVRRWIGQDTSGNQVGRSAVKFWLFLHQARRNLSALSAIPAPRTFLMLCDAGGSQRCHPFKLVILILGKILGPRCENVVVRVLTI